MWQTVRSSRQRISLGALHLALVAYAPLLVASKMSGDEHLRVPASWVLLAIVGVCAVSATVLLRTPAWRWTHWALPSGLAAWGTWQALAVPSAKSLASVSVAGFCVAVTFGAAGAQHMLSSEPRHAGGKRAIGLGALAVVGLGVTWACTRSQSDNSWFTVVLVGSCLAALVQGASRVPRPGKRERTSGDAHAGALVLGAGLMFPALAALSVGAAAAVLQGTVGGEVAWRMARDAARAEWAYSIPVTALLLIGFVGRFSFASAGIRGVSADAGLWSGAAIFTLVLLLVGVRGAERGRLEAPGTQRGAPTTTNEAVGDDVQRGASAESKIAVAGRVGVEGSRLGSAADRGEAAQGGAASGAAVIGGAGSGPADVSGAGSGPAGVGGASAGVAGGSGRAPFADSSAQLDVGSASAGAMGTRGGRHRAEISVAVEAAEGMDRMEAQKAIEQRLALFNECRELETVGPRELRLQLRIQPAGGVTLVTREQDEASERLQEGPDDMATCIMVALYRMGFPPRRSATVAEVEVSLRVR